MKYNVLGFYQPRAVELGLCSDDLLVLRWFVDFAGTPKMRTMIIDNQIYYWVNYSTVLEELPILRISKQTLYKKHFTNLCNANVLTHKQVKDGGNFSYYCYGINYETLVYLQSEEDPLVKNNDLVSKSTKGSVEMNQTLVSKSTEQRLINNIINLQDNKKENILKEKVDWESKFEKLWSIYPRKKNKQLAKKTFEHKIRGLDNQECVDKCNAIYKAQVISTNEWKTNNTDEQFIPHYSSWLNNNVPNSPKYKGR